MPKAVKPNRQYILDRITINEYTDCWEWNLFRDSRGYGSLSNNGVTKRPHQLAYELWRGKVPEGLEIDHLCRNPCCCNPRHLDAVTHAVNMARSGAMREKATHCKYGHEFKLHGFRAGRQRLCRICHRARGRKEDSKPERRAKKTLKRSIKRHTRIS